MCEHSWRCANKISAKRLTVLGDTFCVACLSCSAKCCCGWWDYEHRSYVSWSRIYIRFERYYFNARKLPHSSHIPRPINTVPKAHYHHFAMQFPKSDTEVVMATLPMLRDVPLIETPIKKNWKCTHYWQSLYIHVLNSSVYIVQWSMFVDNARIELVMDGARLACRPIRLWD